MAPTLHALARDDVHRICSGQSVVDLATCVKELVENALDAGATQIEVKLHEYGRDAIEVSDNGAGIAAANYAALARKHYTSKISAFEDIASVSSFGFRGEALSSICQLVSSFTVSTRTAEDELATVLTYDRAGELVQQAKKARPIGTTVVVEELFKPLPVRLKDFHRNIKKHYTKLLKVLQAYAVSCVHAKISVSNNTGKSNRQVVLTTQAHASMGDNIASVFGTKFFRTLKSVDFDLNETWQQVPEKPKRAKTKKRHVFERDGNPQGDSQEADEETKEGDAEPEDDPTLSQHSASLQRKVVGFVSKVGEGVGRSDNDRQFFFINNRPFDLPKLSKAVNDVWRQFEMKQKPACVLNFLLPNGEFDVNVTPDKRETFVKNEAHVIESFKVQLTRMYEPSRGTFFVQPLLTTFAKSNETNRSQPTSVPIVQETTKAQERDESELAHDAGAGEIDVVSSQHIAGLTITFEPLPARQPESDQPKATSTHEHHGCCSGDGGHSHDNDVHMGVSATEDNAVTSARVIQHDPDQEMFAKASSMDQPRYLAYTRQEKPDAVADSEEPPPKKQKSTADSPPGSRDDSVRVTTARPPSSTSARQLDGFIGEWSFAEMKRQRETFFRQEVEIEQRRAQAKTRRLSISKANHADALEPDNDLAAAALQRVLKKDDFRRMGVVGQFNLGFIIGKLDDDDLFIIDQHASDEKYNYETLQQTTVLHQQPLVRPLPLELTAGEEMVILDHLDVFTRHGFTFLVRKDAPPTKKLQLLSLPFSKQTQFGVDDIRELASLLMDTPLNPENVRLPKLMAMFASRACRSSIMIGTALHKEDMRKIVRNLATLEQPWNCPHGRPTLRHLLDLAQLDDAQS